MSSFTQAPHPPDAVLFEVEIALPLVNTGGKRFAIADRGLPRSQAFTCSYPPLSLVSDMPEAALTFSASSSSRPSSWYPELSTPDYWGRRLYRFNLQMR